MVAPLFSASWASLLPLGEHEKMFRKHKWEPGLLRRLFAETSSKFLLFYKTQMGKDNSKRGKPSCIESLS